MTYTQQVRESYGDTVEEFALRLNTSPATIKRWEEGQTPQEPARALLKYADNYALSREPRINAYFAQLSVAEQVRELMENFGDDQSSLARRIGVDVHSVGRWLALNNWSPITQRLIYEVAVHPERFMRYPKSYGK